MPLVWKWGRLPDRRPVVSAHQQESGPAEPESVGVSPGPRSAWAALLLVLPGIISLYAWLAADGGRTKLPRQTTFYYDMLADGLASGQTFLEQAPDPRLARLVNPYDPVERAGIPKCRQDTPSGCFLLDASYFGGKYYLYWGPAPAALLAVLKDGGIGKLGDATIALAAALALAFLLTFCLVDLWHRHFLRLPRWLLVPPLFLAGLAYPLPWVLDAPRIYEAAILVGAAFLVGGLALALPALASGDHSPWRLTLAGILWSMAFASRAVLALPVAVLAGAIVWRLIRLPSTDSPPRSVWKALAFLTFPMAVSTSLIGMYNFVRFSNPLETGWRYALAGSGAQSAGLRAVFNLGNIPTNAYNYLFARVSWSGHFPFIEPALATRAIGPIEIPHPGLFYGEHVTGLVITTPFLLFAVYLCWWLTCASVDSARAAEMGVSSAPPGQAGFRRLVLALLLAGLAAFLPILCVYAVTARYLLDVSPVLTVLAALGSWKAYETARTPATRWVIGSTIVAMAAVSGAVSVLLAVDNLSR